VACLVVQRDMPHKHVYVIVGGDRKGFLNFRNNMAHRRNRGEERRVKNPWEKGWGEKGGEGGREGVWGNRGWGRGVGVQTILR
jgi:hypothetical protein